jgi:glycine/D-amino acid oxidase-like deaminating enzyme
MRWRFGKRPPLQQISDVVRWGSATVWSTIPTAQQWATVSPWVSRTPYWLRDGNPLAGHPWIEQPDSKLPETADVVVVGAGFGGASLAYHWASLAEGSLVVLEKDDPASGAAGRNGGFVAPAGWYPGYYVYHPLEKEIQRVRPDLAPSARLALVEAMADAYAFALAGSEEMIHETIMRENISCDYARKGWIFTTDSIGKSEMDSSLVLARERGWDGYVSLDPEEIQRATGIRTEISGSHMRGAGTWHPAKWVWSLFRLALERGDVQLFTRTPATQVVRDGQMYRVITPRGEIRARHVVSATEAHTQRAFGNFLAPYREFILPHRSQGGYAEGRPPEMVLGQGSSGPFTWFHPRENGFAFGSDTTPIPHEDVWLNNPSRMITLSSVAEAYRLWGLTPLTIYNEWTGSVALSPDNYPVIGSLDGHGAWICGAYAGAGSTCSFRGALRMINAVLGRDDELDAFPDEFFSPARFRRDGRYGDPVRPRTTLNHVR